MSGWPRLHWVQSSEGLLVGHTPGGEIVGRVGVLDSDVEDRQTVYKTHCWRVNTPGGDLWAEGQSNSLKNALRSCEKYHGLCARGLPGRATVPAYQDHTGTERATA